MDYIKLYLELESRVSKLIRISRESSVEIHLTIEIVKYLISYYRSSYPILRASPHPFPWFRY